MHLAMRLHLAKTKKVNYTTPPTSEEKPDYEELSDGSFQCLHCDKSYQPSSRAESYMKSHVTKEHL